MNKEQAIAASRKRSQEMDHKITTEDSEPSNVVPMSRVIVPGSFAPAPAQRPAQLDSAL